MIFIATCLGGEIVSTFGRPELVRLGECKLIEEVMIGEDKVSFREWISFFLMLFYLVAVLVRFAEVCFFIDITCKINTFPPLSSLATLVFQYFPNICPIHVIFEITQLCFNF